MPLLDVEEYPDASTRGHSSPLDAVRSVARSAEQVEETGRPALKAEVLLERWRGLTHLDADRLRHDVDELLDPSI